MIGVNDQGENSQKVSLALNSVYTWVDGAGTGYLARTARKATRRGWVREPRQGAGSRLMAKFFRLSEEPIHKNLALLVFAGIFI